MQSANRSYLALFEIEPRIVPDSAPTVSPPVDDIVAVTTETPPAVAPVADTSTPDNLAYPPEFLNWLDTLLEADTDLTLYRRPFRVSTTCSTAKTRTPCHQRRRRWNTSKAATTPGRWKRWQRKCLHRIQKIHQLKRLNLPCVQQWCRRQLQGTTTRKTHTCHQSQPSYLIKTTQKRRRIRVGISINSRRSTRGSIPNVAGRSQCTATRQHRPHNITTSTTTWMNSGMSIGRVVLNRTKRQHSQNMKRQ